MNIAHLIWIVFCVTLTDGSFKPIQRTSLDNSVFVIMSQPQERNAKIGEETERKLTSTLKKGNVQNSTVFLLHRDLNVQGNWAVLPILPILNQVGGIFGKTNWFVFLPESAEINVEMLKKVVSRYSQKDLALIGRLNRNEHPSALHRWSEEMIDYPGSNMF